MYRATCAALAMMGLMARVGVGYGPVDCCLPPCCEPAPLECCDPCAPALAETEKAPTKPGPLPTPAAKPETSSTPSSASAEASSSELPTPARPDADALSPQPLNTPTAETPPSAAPATVEQTAPTAAAAEEEPAPAEQVDNRYSTPPDSPAAASAAPETAAVEDVFSENVDPSESATATTESAPTDAEAPAAAETSPGDATAPAESGAEPPASTPAEAAPAEAAPASETPDSTPDYNDLFGPTSSTEILRVPGGLASAAGRVWSDADGRILAMGRVTAAAADHIVLAGDNGGVRSVRYAELSDADLGFLRQQIEARRAQLARQQAAELLLATQQ